MVNKQGFGRRMVKVKNQGMRRHMGNAEWYKGVHIVK